MRAWIEPNDDPVFMVTIDEYDQGVLEKSTSYISRPFQWTIEDIEPIDYAE